MRKVWPRESRARRLCRCFGSQSIAAYKSPSAGLLQFKHLTTLFYASLITIAALADARVKQKRRERWDDIIQQAELELKAERKFGQDILHGSYARPAKACAVTVRAVVGQVGAQHLASQQISLGDPFDPSPQRLWTGSATRPRSSVAGTASHKLRRYDIESRRGLHTATRRPSYLQIMEETRTETIREQQASPQALPAVKRRLVSLFDETRVPPVDCVSPHLPSQRSSPSPASIYASETQPAGAAEPWTPKKLLVAEYAIAKLATSLLLRTRSDHEGGHRSSRHKADAMSRDDLLMNLKHTESKLAEALKKTRSEAFDVSDLETFRFPTFTHDRTSWQGTNSALGGSLQALLARYANRKLGRNRLLKGVAYHLLTAEAPPNAETFTMLITRLSQNKLYEEADAVVEAFRSSRVRWNEWSAAAILGHYKRKGDFDQFHRFVMVLQGLFEGPMLARPEVEITHAGKHRLVVKGDKVIQLVNFDQPVYSVIISGYLRLKHDKYALYWYERMLEEGIAPTNSTMYSFLSYFAHRGSWTRGFGVWQNMRQTFISATTTNLSDRSTERYSYFSILQLCKKAKETEHFKEIYTEALQKGFRLDELLVRAVALRPGRKSPGVEKLKAQVRILERRAALIEEDVRSWTLHFAAAKALLDGVPVRDVRELFDRFHREERLDAVYPDKPWEPVRLNLRVTSRSTAALQHRATKAGEPSPAPDQQTPAYTAPVGQRSLDGEQVKHAPAPPPAVPAVAHQSNRHGARWTRAQPDDFHNTGTAWRQRVSSDRSDRQQSSSVVAAAA